jgi:hypothetical protein
MKVVRTLVASAILCAGASALTRAQGGAPLDPSAGEEMRAGFGEETGRPLGLDERGSGIQITPDDLGVLVAKDVADQRWSITRNLDDMTVTGNVFFPGGGDPLFLFCEQQGQDGDDLELRCSGADRCRDTSCPDFEFVADVVLPRSFFDPEPLAARPTARSRALARIEMAALRAASRARDALGDERPQGGTSRGSGIQMTPDGERVLINKDVGEQRWTIVRNRDGTVTGNVFSTDGGEPLFVFCEEQDAFGDDLRLRCSAAGSCSTESCPEFAFAGDVTLPKSFFEAPGPLPSKPPTPTPPHPGPGSTAPPGPTAPPGTTATPGTSATPTRSPTPSPPTDQTPTPAPSSSPGPSSTAPPPPPSATAPPPGPTATAVPPGTPTPDPCELEIAGVCQGNCRNAVLDPGEDCDAGGRNSECFFDPEFTCSPASPVNFECLYCTRVVGPGPVPGGGAPPSRDCVPSCARGEATVTVDDLSSRVCNDNPNLRPDSSNCTVEIGGQSVGFDCRSENPVPSGPPSDRDALVADLRTLECCTQTCLPPGDLRGSCGPGDRGEACTLSVDGNDLPGVCEGLAGQLICAVDGVVQGRD